MIVGKTRTIIEPTKHYFGHKNDACVRNRIWRPGGKRIRRKGQEIIVTALIMLGHVENCHVLIDDL
ncbi:hypothetical protein NC651_013215 [Populus alba x Populus x berolinensis]|nr:hypothetical protein NC651_013215 [Populus alba x Populus x berolinensis]